MAADRELTVPELQGILRALRVPFTGATKPVMISRIERRLAWAKRVRDADLAKQTVPELRELLAGSMFQKHWRYKKRGELLKILAYLADLKPEHQAAYAKPKRDRTYDVLVWTHPVTGRRVTLTTVPDRFNQRRVAAERFAFADVVDLDLEERRGLSYAQVEALEPTEQESDDATFLLADNIEMMFWSDAQRGERQRKIDRLLGRSTTPRDNPTGPGVSLVAIAFRRHPDLLRELRADEGPATIDHAAQRLAEWSGKPYAQVRSSALGTLATYVRTNVVEPRSFVRWLTQRDPRLAIWCTLACVRQLAKDTPEGMTAPVSNAIYIADAWVRDPSAPVLRSGFIRQAARSRVGKLRQAADEVVLACSYASMERVTSVFVQLELAIDDVLSAYGGGGSASARLKKINATKSQIVETMADAIVKLPDTRG